MTGGSAGRALSSARRACGLVINSVWSRLTQDIRPMLVWCWASVVDADPTWNQHWVNVLCLLGYWICAFCLSYLVISSLPARLPACLSSLTENIKYYTSACSLNSGWCRLLGQHRTNVGWNIFIWRSLSSHHRTRLYLHKVDNQICKDLVRLKLQLKKPKKPAIIGSLLITRLNEREQCVDETTQGQLWYPIYSTGSLDPLWKIATERHDCNVHKRHCRQI